MKIHASSILSLLLLVGLSGLMSSCVRKAIPTSQRSLDEYLIVEREKNKYQLTFPKEADWTIYSGTAPSVIDWKQAFRTFSGKTLRFRYDESAPRLFFGIKMSDGSLLVASERQIHLNDAPNFRDLGGIPTRDDRIVKWGELYRSGSLHELKPNDFERLEALEINTVCDLRNDIEVGNRPTILPDDILYEQHAIGGKEGAAYADLKRQIKEEKYRGTQIRDIFVDIMTSFTDSAALDFKPVIDNMLAEDKTPMVFHCAGGKDRTGFLAAIILSALNVDRETVKQDYLMSNFYRQHHNRSRARLAKLIFYDNETLKYGLMVHEAYIDAVFEVIDRDFGGMDNYLAEKFDLNTEKRRLLMERYTVPVERM